ncbi:MAG: class II fructose-bisphosphate aldolase [Candidatus Moraniibacteriota bacterium]
MRKNAIEILKKAVKENTAVGAFNTSNMEVTQGIVWAAKKLNKDCIVQATNSTVEYTNEAIGFIVENIVEKESGSASVGFHLDHGHNLHDIVKAIDLGVDSVMIDASKMSFEENKTITKKVVEYAHPKGVSVQAELGRVPYLGRERMSVEWDKVMTNPQEAKQMVDETGVDALAVAIGNAHGFFRERNEPDWDRLKEIRRLLPELPLILHGASDWEGDKARKAVKLGINCFNIDTDLRIAFSTALCKMTGGNHCEVNDPRKILKECREEVRKKTEEKINLFNS